MGLCTHICRHGCLLIVIFEVQRPLLKSFYLLSGGFIDLFLCTCVVLRFSICSLGIPPNDRFFGLKSFYTICTFFLFFCPSTQGMYPFFVVFEKYSYGLQTISSLVDVLLRIFINFLKHFRYEFVLSFYTTLTEWLISYNCFSNFHKTKC